MAISAKESALLFYARKLGANFERTLMLGRLQLDASKAEVQSIGAKYNVGSITDFLSSDSKYAEPLFKILGAKSVESLDYSDYENATLIHDMNLPVDSQWHSQYSAIVDGGTIEHIFNFPIAIKNCMEMLRVGGWYIGISPANNQMGHGFYQYSPELFYRIFTKANGFEVKKMLITVPEKGAWYEVGDPAILKSRVMLVNNSPLSLVILAQKVATTEIFRQAPQQSDYVSTWAKTDSIRNSQPVIGEPKFHFFYRKFFPKPLKAITRAIYDSIFVKKRYSETLGSFNAEHFREIDI